MSDMFELVAMPDLRLVEDTPPCPQCGAPVPPGPKNKRYCSTRCQLKFNKKRQKAREREKRRALRAAGQLPPPAPAHKSKIVCPHCHKRITLAIKPHITTNHT